MIGLGAIIISLFVIVIVKARTKTLLKKQNENRLFINEMIEAFAKTIDMKDRYTKGHSTRVAEYTAMLARELGYDDETVEKYHNIALLHDIGKIGIKPEVLNKEGKLTDEEFTIIKSHSIQGYNVLKDISIMPELAIGAGAHHERPDGKGYPKGLKGDEIPRVAQIIAVADTFDAMYSDRPYRKRMNFEKAVSIIKEVSGTQLTADVVDANSLKIDSSYMSGYRIVVEFKKVSNTEYTYNNDLRSNTTTKTTVQKSDYYYATLEIPFGSGDINQYHNDL